MSLPDPSQNPAPPSGWHYMPQANVTQNMTIWSTSILHDTVNYPGPLPYWLVPNIIDGKAVKASVQSHIPDAQNGQIHRGVSLFEPISPTPPSSGLDVSKYQGAINFNEVRKTCQFIFVKASEGTNIVDPDFATDWQASKVAGLLRGAYAFLHPSEDGVAQAKLFLQTLNGDFGELPCVVDFETVDGLKSSDPRIPTCLASFLDTVQAATKRTGMIYTAPGFWNPIASAQASAMSAIAAKTLLWVANWGIGYPAVIPAGWKNWTFWQHTDAASIPGVNGNVDSDYYNGTETELAPFAGQIPAPPPPPVSALPPAAVKMVQAGVNACGYTPQLAVDGIPGPLTKAGLVWVEGFCK